MGEWTRRAEQAIDAFNTGDHSSLIDALDEHVEWVDRGLPAPLRGPAEVRAFMELFRKAFPDAGMTIREAIESDNSLALEVTWTGTHLGPLPMGSIPATGRRVEVDACDVFNMRDGKILHARIYSENLQLLAQLGVLPAPASAT
jgi:steroid delta-isomerase-like uncharacterized protein